jgi:hypothetical protein
MKSPTTISRDDISRSWITILIAIGGLLGLTVPSSTIQILNVFPTLDITGSNATRLIRVAGAGYLAAGVFVTWCIIRDRPNDLPHIVAGVLVSWIGMVIARLLWLPQSDMTVVVYFGAVLWPLLAGSITSITSRIASILLIPLLIGVGSVIHGPPVDTLTPAWLQVTIGTILSVLWGLPLYAVGWQWRRSILRRSAS